MSRPEKVTLEFNGDSFTGRIQRAAAAASSLNRELALRDATWEPHDWSDWS